MLDDDEASSSYVCNVHLKLGSLRMKKKGMAEVEGTTYCEDVYLFLLTSDTDVATSTPAGRPPLNDARIRPFACPLSAFEF